jgi:hypothetical protein
MKGKVSRPVKQSGLKWYGVVKSKDTAENGKVIDCAQATSLDVAFNWACDKWSKLIERSHDITKDTDAYCLYVVALDDLKPLKRGAPQISPIVQPTARELETYGVAQ